MKKEEEEDKEEEKEWTKGNKHNSSSKKSLKSEVEEGRRALRIWLNGVTELKEESKDHSYFI
uniref:Uncharacterized protein n=1 Tax=Mustela putorius furo TaxID=9669 RepID=M3YH92_MUSPF